jgi:hypothetical protein
MGLPGIRLLIWWLMTVVAMVARAIGAAFAFSGKPNSAGNVLAGWLALYGIPALLIVARGIPARKAIKIVGRIVRFGLPVAAFVGLLSFAMTGYVSLIGGSMLATLMISWGALLAAALFSDKAVRPES